MRTSALSRDDAHTQALLEELERREEAKIHMASFVPYVTEGDHKPFPHHKVICDALDRALRGTCKRLIIAAPPSAGAPIP